MQPVIESLNKPGGLAERLRRLRKTAGLTGDELADRYGWQRTKVSKLENARQWPTTTDLENWAAACGHPEAVPELQALLDEAEAVRRQIRHQRHRGQAAIQEEFDRAVRQGKRIRNFEVTFIPGLLQTADYARYRSLEAVRVHGFAVDAVEASVSARMKRQEVLYEPGRQFDFILTEAALRFLVCPAGVMLGQLDRLATLSGLASITLGVIPFDTELQVAPVNGFLIVDDVTYVETHDALEDVHGQESADYERIADGLMAEALTGDGALRVISEAAARVRGA